MGRIPECIAVAHFVAERLRVPRGGGRGGCGPHCRRHGKPRRYKKANAAGSSAGVAAAAGVGRAATFFPCRLKAELRTKACARHRMPSVPCLLSPVPWPSLQPSRFSIRNSLSAPPRLCASAHSGGRWCAEPRADARGQLVRGGRSRRGVGNASCGRGIVCQTRGNRGPYDERVQPWMQR